ncbi:hypothetical protein M9Y10_009693 [Tritrichomonas musculus]|uniref:Uncharacterized protein n=1 Tax=Tritrichomonas musculus TaxID=1915356 RepID=A0ABR2IRC8_9EUKA
MFRQSTPNLIRSIPLKKNSALQQYRIDPHSASSSTSSDIEVCVESVLMPDTEELCCQSLINRHLKQKMFFRWKNKHLLIAEPVLNSDEIRGIKEQSNRNASAELRRIRHRFLGQFANLASFTLNRLILSRSFAKWIERFDRSRLRKTQESVADILQVKKAQGKVFHNMRSQVLRSMENKYVSVSKSIIQMSSGDRLKQLTEEIKRTERKNASLESEISVKTSQLSELQMSLRNATADGIEAAKRLKELKESTEALQNSLNSTEQKYQEEITQLRAQMSLQSKEANDELSRIDSELRKQAAERKAAYAFQDDAQLAAVAELQQQQEKLQQAQKIVKSLEDLLVSSQAKSEKLRNVKQTMIAELETLRMKKRQAETTFSTSRVVSADREQKMMQMLRESQEQLKSAQLRLDTQASQIQSKQQEIAMLQQDIAIEKTSIREAQNKFLSSMAQQRGSPTRNYD